MADFDQIPVRFFRKRRVCYNRIMSGNAKVLTGLVERRALEAQFAALAGLTDAEEIARRAGEIAAYGNAALSLLISRLDTEDPQVRGSLGQVAKRLDHDQVVAALRGVARSRERKDQARLSAVTILNRYLDEPVDESLLADIQDPDGAAVRSLRELMQAMDREEVAIIEYLNQLAEQAPEVAGMILDAIPRLSPHPHLTTLMRMFAQGESQPLARSAIEQLGRTRSTEALAALDALFSALPPQLAGLADRNRRKLRMSGVPEQANVAERGDWRVLLSPVDGAGAQVVWFINRPAGHDQDTWLTVITRDPNGIVASFGAVAVPGDKLPPAQPLGSMHTLPQEEGAPPLQLLEVSFDAGRRAVQRALERHWATNTRPPLEYRLLNPQIWDARLAIGEPATVAPGPYSAAQTAALLDHPAFVSWFWRNEALLDAARRLSARQGQARARHISSLASIHFGPDIITSYQRRLEAMADWLALAGQTQAAALAMSAAAHLAEGAAAESPFVRRLIGISLDVAAVSLKANRV